MRNVATSRFVARQPRQPARRRADDIAVYVAVVLGYVLLLPPQLNLMIGSVVLPPYRFFLIPASLYVISIALAGHLKLRWPDILVGLATAWMALALFMTTEPAEAFTSAVAQTTDIALAYFLARACFRDLRDVRLFLLLLAPGIAAAAIILAIESITHQHIVHPFFASITGQRHYLGPDQRLGLLRAAGPFAHPILAGIFLASFLPLFWLSGLRGWPKVIGIVAALCSFFTVSSAAVLGLTVSIALVTYNWLGERLANLSWRMFFIVASIGVFAAELGTKSGSFNLIMRYASLNSSSAFNRVLIWKYGTQNVEKSPWFGIGFADWERPSWMVASIDHYWLLLAIQFGIVPPVLIAIAVFMAIVALARASSRVPIVDRRSMRGIAIAMAVFALGVISVSIWLSAQVWFYMLLGICVSLGAQFEASPARFRPVTFRPIPPSVVRLT